MLLDVLQCTRQLPTTKRFLPQMPIVPLLRNPDHADRPILPNGETKARRRKGAARGGPVSQVSRLP